MKFGNVFKICLAMVVFTLLCPSMSSGFWTEVFYDDFDGTALDTSKWKVFEDALGYSNAPWVADGLLQSASYHTRIDSIPPTFVPPVLARARIRLAGEVHKFGFAVNPNERAGPISGYFFDTYHLDPLQPPEAQGRENYVRAVAWFQPDNGPFEELLNVEIYVTWYEFHVFAIERTPSEVIYSIGDLIGDSIVYTEVARVAHAFAGALPVGVWNDRWDLMQTDWVKVYVPEPATVLLLGLGGLTILRKRRS